MKVIQLGISELDRDLGGGIPTPSLISIEGDYGSGKTVFVQQAVYAMLKKGLSLRRIKRSHRERVSLNDGVR
jgi:flagellar protein FlaH